MHPKLKSLKLLESEEDILSVHNEVRCLMSEILDQKGQPCATAGATKFIPAKKMKMTKKIDDLADVEDSSDDADVLPPDEVQCYIEYKCPKTNKDEDLNLLCWWKDRTTVHPSLAQMARFILAIPATSALSERDFSTVGFIVQERRT
ncbi:UNVERIFIED_CONTAM: hypothetical protein FKN15_033803 [Acipenser sinensis]